MTHEETDYYDWDEEIRELTEELDKETIALTRKDLEVIMQGFSRLLEKKYPYYPYPKTPKTKDECIALGGEWDPETNTCKLPAKESTAYGHGIVYTEEPELREKYKRIAECLRKGTKLNEQWVAPVIKASKEIIGHVREFCTVETILEDKPGDTIYLATVRDFDLGDWSTYGSPTLADETTSDVVAFTSATVQEAGVKFYLKQHLTEKADADVIELINEVSRRAVLRAEDKKILSDIYNTTGVLSLDKSAAGVDFDADWVAEIITTFEANGVHVDAGDLVLFISPSMYDALLKDVAGSMAITFARPDVIQKGRLVEFMGVTIRVVSKSILPNDGLNLYAIAFKKGAYTLAPKRNFLVETDPDPQNRQTLTVVTTACAGVLGNPNYGLKLKTQLTP
jgi:hypothetical protein